MADHAGPERLGDAAVEQLLMRLDDRLAQLERIPGRTAELAMEALEGLTGIYGEALARVVDHAADAPGLLDRLTDDELLRHLLLLHRIHPHSVERRVIRAVDDLRPALRSQGVEIKQIAVRDRVAQLTVSTRSCGHCGSAAVPHDLIREQVLTVAPELSDVEVVTATPAPPLIPVTALRHRPGQAAAVQATAGTATAVAAPSETAGHGETPQRGASTDGAEATQGTPAVLAAGSAKTAQGGAGR